MIMQIEIPSARHSKEIALKEAERKAILRAEEEKRKQERKAKEIAKSWEIEIPTLIQTIKDKIINYSNEGYCSFEFDIRDSGLKCSPDERIDYYFKGFLTDEMIEVVEKTFSMAGYEISGHNMFINWNSYRTATFKVSW